MLSRMLGFWFVRFAHGVVWTGMRIIFESVQRIFCAVLKALPSRVPSALCYAFVNDRRVYPGWCAYQVDRGLKFVFFAFSVELILKKVFETSWKQDLLRSASLVIVLQALKCLFHVLRLYPRNSSRLRVHQQILQVHFLAFCRLSWEAWCPTHMVKPIRDTYAPKHSFLLL